MSSEGVEAEVSSADEGGLAAAAGLEVKDNMLWMYFFFLDG